MKDKDNIMSPQNNIIYDEQINNINNFTLNNHNMNNGHNIGDEYSDESYEIRHINNINKKDNLMDENNILNNNNDNNNNNNDKSNLVLHNNNDKSNHFLHNNNNDSYNYDIYNHFHTYNNCNLYNDDKNELSKKGAVLNRYNEQEQNIPIEHEYNNISYPSLIKNNKNNSEKKYLDNLSINLKDEKNYHPEKKNFNNNLEKNNKIFTNDIEHISFNKKICKIKNIYSENKNNQFFKNNTNHLFNTNINLYEKKNYVDDEFSHHKDPIKFSSLIKNKQNNNNSFMNLLNDNQYVKINNQNTFNNPNKYHHMKNKINK